MNLSNKKVVFNIKWEVSLDNVVANGVQDELDNLNEQGYAELINIEIEDED